MILFVIAWILSGVIGVALILWTDRSDQDQLDLWVAIFCILCGPGAILASCLYIIQRGGISFLNKEVRNPFKKSGEDK